MRSVAPSPVDDPESSQLTLATQVHDLLRADIIRGDLKPGQKLKIAETSARYGVGVIPVREALSRLAMSGFVDARDQRGFCVREVSAAELIDFTRVRILVESAALRESIELGGSDWEGRVVGALHALSCLNAFPDATRRKIDIQWERAHERFHFELLSGCQSPSLLRIAGELRDQTTRYRHITVASRTTPSRNFADEHKAIVDASIHHKADLAVALLSEHTLTSSGIALAEFGAPSIEKIELLKGRFPRELMAIPASVSLQKSTG
jgi:DNA-binding GntR family transcriptional regulator